MSIRDLVPWSRGKSPSLAPRESYDPFVSLRDEMNRLFDNFHNGFELAPFAESSGWMPRVNVTENDKAILVSAELPGMEEKDIDVSYEHGMLTIKGEKKQEHEEKGKNFYRSERSFGSFQRSIELPCEVEEGKIEAQYKKGVLNLTLPKTKESIGKSRKIPVKTA
ncbi:MAG TPA: Hsp20/alpha crystallin family protein [Planctomycetota bacterium]|nr:Hsp20/alpha crystallin family protein [Planctomycetota bacterium]